MHANNSENDIHLILNDALSQNSNQNGRGGDSLHEASVKIEAYAEAAMEMIQEAENSSNNSIEKIENGSKLYCSVCIER